ncbi:hypothetical protein [Phytohabitans houttuyneae]|uniref:Glycosyltransferase RgtA/B/C/D-like domain-containing protein n=1 Tax=Phytohabitans houttuyneae TaxID=1076126 RepID=A0A6V8KLN0_9ACTN|nr:hypothetical protein [Phytohabitans houttuyneae]GFJ83321.1 hypothetical protein Phou_075010 [Phytohabitans houttuyneae]
MLYRPAPTGATGVRTRRAWLVDGAAVLILLALVPVVHRVGPMLRAPFWLDEAWVAMSARGSLRQALDLTGPTPVGWTLLMRAIPGDGPERLRWLPFLFLAASVPAGYALGRLLGWERRAYAVLAGLTGAAGALLLPAQQVRHDLKQYTADGAIAVALLALAAWAESRWSYRRLAVFAGCAVAAMFFSHPALLVGGAGLGAFVLVALHRRARDDLRVALRVAAAGWLVMAACYLTVSRRGQIESLETYWDDYFLSFTSGPSLPSYLGARLDELGDLFGLPWPVFALLAAAGVATMAKTGRPVAAATMAALPAGVVVAGYLRAYPVLDQRTSHFLLVASAVSAGIGVVGAARLAASLLQRRRPGVTAAVAAAAVTAFALANAGWFRYYAPPGIYPRQPDAFAAGYLRYDIRDQVRYVEAHRRPGDVVLVNSWGNFGFAYYWRPDAPTFVRDTDFGNGWAAGYRDSARIVVAAERDEPALADALARAESLLAPGGRIWLVRTHLEFFELAGWQEALRDRPVEWIPVGPELLGLVTPAPAGGRQ